MFKLIKVNQCFIKMLLQKSQRLKCNSLNLLTLTISHHIHANKTLKDVQ